MRHGLAAVVAASSLASAGAAQAPGSETSSPQKQFEQASAALVAGRPAEALAGFEAVEKRLAGSKSAKSLGVVRTRKGEALLQLGREEEARIATEQGLAALPASDPSLREDRFLSQILLGRIAERNLDYGQALIRYQGAEAIAATPAEQGMAMRGLVQTGMFLNGPEALAAADRAIALVTAQAPGEKALLAQMRSLRGRVLLNLGRHGEARDELRKAVGMLGGLTTRVDAADLGARSDMSLALLLLGDEEGAREYLAYTGAGRIKQGFGPGADMKPPPCGEDGLQPHDVAVVQFSIRDNGEVGAVSPIYASRQGESAIAFARAVRGWSWQPSEVAAIPPLLRALTRVELRCSSAVDRPDPLELLEADALPWFETKGVTDFSVSDQPSARTFEPLKAELSRREAAEGAASLRSLPILIALAHHPLTGYADRAAYLRRALPIAVQAGAPPELEALIKLRLALAAHAARETRRTLDLQPLFADPVFAKSPRAAAALRLVAEGQIADLKDRTRSRQLLQQVVATPGLAPNDPLRVGALLRLSSVELAAGDAASARSAFTATGLSGQQCALVDPGPAKASGNMSSNDFPNEALRWGFEGFTTIEHDVLADGRVSEPRAVVSYPPFVFSRASTRGIGRFRFDPSYRPDGSIGCGGKSTRIRYVLPDS
jgi:tetratricopeptide (TPR) repeat protein